MSPQFQNSLFQSKLVLPMLFIISIHRAESTNSFACDPANVPTQNLPFCDMSLPIQERVNDLISRLNFAEKISLLGNNAAPVPRLGINSYKWWSEALHGVSYVGGGVQFGGDFPAATSFPQVILTAASFNFCLWEEIGRVVSDEARAMYNGGHAGLTYWSPTINILRDPRWGRAQETTGEDPYLAGEYARSYVKGLQGSDSSNNGPLKVAACCKHFTAYDLDNWNHTDRFHFDARVTQQDLDDTYNVPFEKCVVDGNVACVMCSYNKVNGKPTCADPNLLKNTVRGQWNLNGYIVSDCDSVEVLFKHHKYTRTPEEAVAKSMKAGLDLNCGKYLQKYAGHAIWMRMMKEDDVDVAINNTLKVQMRLGMYDGKPSKQPYGMLGPNDVCKPYHQQLAVEAARQGIVLLQNNKSSLPLSKHKHKEIAVIGPNADVTVTMIGNYFGIPCNYVTPLQGIRAYANTKYQKACKDVACNDNGGFAAAVLAAQKADAAVLVMGLDQSMEREGLDRPTLLLPENQRDLISRVAKVSKGPVILVLMSGGPIDVSFAKDDPRIGAILWAGYPGQAGGTAIADVVFGTDIPGGNLPMTWYPESYLAMAPMTDMRMRADDAGYPGRTYRFYEGRVVFPFGHGLSYSTFQKRLVQAPTKFCIPYASSLYTSKNSTKLGDFVRVSHAHCSKLSLSLHVEVRNTGTVDGSHTVLMFAEPPAAMGRSTPRKQLISFEKVHLVAGSQKQVKMGIDVCKHLSLVDQFGVRKIPMGEHTLHIGNLKHSINLQATS